MGRSRGARVKAVLAVGAHSALGVGNEPCVVGKTPSGTFLALSVSNEPCGAGKTPSGTFFALSVGNEPCDVGKPPSWAQIVADVD